MLIPKRIKYRRPHRLSHEGRTKAGHEVSFGKYDLMADTDAYVSNRRIEAARITMTHYMKRGGKVWICIFPHMARTKKPLEMRVGSGKGTPKGQVAVVKPGRIMLEIASVPGGVVHEVFRLAAHKLPMKIKFVVRKEEK